MQPSLIFFSSSLSLSLISNTVVAAAAVFSRSAVQRIISTAIEWRMIDFDIYTRI